MEIIFELLFEIFVEGCMDAAGHPRVPKWVRILLMTVPFAIIETVFIFGARAGVHNRSFFLAVFCISMAGAFLLLWIYLLMKIWKNRPFHH